MLEEAEAQSQLRRIVEELQAVGFRLRAIAAGLPVSPRETAMLLGEEEPDVATEVRSVIECVLADQLEPAVRDLGAAASYRRRTEGG